MVNLMSKIKSNAEYNQQLHQKYMQLQNQCQLSPSASYDQYIDWFINRYGVYYQEYYLAFCMLLSNRGFNLTSCKIREDIVNKINLRIKDKSNFIDIAFLDESVRMNELDHMSGFKF